MATYILLSNIPTQLQDSVTSLNMSGGSLEFYLAGTSTPTNVFSDNAGTVLGTTVSLNSGGYPQSNDNIVNIFIDAEIALKIIVKDAAGAELVTTQVDALSGTVAALLPANVEDNPGDVTRWGIVANSSAAAAANTTALQTRLSPTSGTFNGVVEFPNSTGSDIYYFNDRIPVRDGIQMNLNGCTLDFTKTGDANDTDGGCFHALRHFSIENGKLDVNYTYVTGTNPFNALMFGGRNNTSVDFGLLRDDLQSEPFGDISVKNLEIDYSGGANSNGVLMYGGLQNVTFENVKVKGNTTLGIGIHYEFGFATDEAAAEDRQSSHANNLSFKNVVIEDTKQLTFGVGLRLAGAWNAEIDNLLVKNCQTGIEFSPGESLFYRPWTPENDAAQRLISMKNVTLTGVNSIGITATGAEDNAGGYLSGVAVTDAEKVDLYDMVLDGFAISGGSVGIASSCGTSTLRNGTITAAANALRFDREAVNFHISNVDAFDSTSTAFRLDFTTGIFATPRMKQGVIDGCFIAGTTGVAITLDYANAVELTNSRFGYTTGHDGVAETTQTAAIQLGANAMAVCSNNYVAAVSSGNAYSGVSGAAGVLVNPLGIRTVSTHWVMDNLLTGITTVGDANKTLTAGTDSRAQQWDTTLTANRTATLSTTSAVKGDRFRVVRTGLGSFTLDVGGLKTIASATAAFVDVEYDGTAWVLTGYGAL